MGRASFFKQREESGAFPGRGVTFSVTKGWPETDAGRLLGLGESRSKLALGGTESHLEGRNWSQEGQRRGDAQHLAEQESGTSTLPINPA